MYKWRFVGVAVRDNSRIVGKPEAIAATALRSHYFWVAHESEASRRGLLSLYNAGVGLGQAEYLIAPPA